MDKDCSKIMIMSDIDGTFIDDREGLVEANLEAVRRFTRAGGHFAFATGRYMRGLDKPIPMWRELMTMPGVFCNGAYIYDHRIDKIIHERPLDEKYTLPLLIEIKRKFPSVLVRYTAGHKVIFIETDTDPTVPLEVPCYKVVLESNSKTLAEVREYVYTRHGDYFAYSKSCDFYLEFLRNDATKGTMLDWLRDYVSKEEGGAPITAYAVGDYENDIEMLRHADVPACPDNGYPMIIDYCREHGLVLCDNNKGTLAALIKHIMDR